MIEEACIQGVSTRSVDERVNALRMGSRIDAGHERPLMAVQRHTPGRSERPLSGGYRLHQHPLPRAAPTRGRRRLQAVLRPSIRSTVDSTIAGLKGLVM